MPAADMREWCGGPCKGTKPLTDEKQREKEERRRELRDSNKARSKATEERLRASHGDHNASSPIQRGMLAGDELERQLDREIHAAQEEGGPVGPDPDFAAWSYSNSLSGNVPTRRFVVPDLPGFSLQGVTTGSPGERRDLVASLSEDGAMGQLDRMIGAAHQMEAFNDPEETETKGGRDSPGSRRQSGMDLVKALATDQGYGTDSDLDY